MEDPTLLIAGSGTGGIAVAAAVAEGVQEPTTPLLILAGVLTSIVALLGWIVRRQQIQHEEQAKADRAEREKDRAHDREERAAALAAFRAEAHADRQSFQERNAAVVAELRGLRGDLASGQGCRAAR